MILQMHMQDRRNPEHTEWVAQSGDIQSVEEFHKWMRGVYERHPLPEGKQWLVCDQTAPCFVVAATRQTEQLSDGVAGTPA
jgi:hypothetical protein